MCSGLICEFLTAWKGRQLLNLRKLLRAKQKYGNLQCTINIFTAIKTTHPQRALKHFCSQ
jgi:hypothetical protein